MVCVHVVRCCIFLALKVDRVPDELRQQARAIADRYFPQDGEDDDDADDNVAAVDVSVIEDDDGDTDGDRVVLWGE